MNSKNYAIARIKKHKLGARASYLVNHHLRLCAVENADPNRAKFNQIIYQVENPTEFLNKVPEKTRKNAVKFVDLLYTASRFETKKQLDEWVKRTVEFIEKKFGKENIALIALHKDETTPHIHCIIKPMKNGKLCASHWFDGMNKMHAYQDEFHATVADLGFDRGVKGSRKKHVTVKQFYGDLSRAEEKYNDFRKELQALYTEAKKKPTLWERFKPEDFFKKLVPHFNKVASSYKKIVGFQEVLRAEKKGDLIETLKKQVADLEHKFEDLSGGVPTWPQLNELKNQLASFKALEDSIKAFERDQKELAELTNSKKETSTFGSKLKK